MKPNTAMIAAAAAVVLGAVWYVKQKGGVVAIAEDVGSTAGEAAVAVVGGAATGVLDGVSKAVGIPTTSETITDAAACKVYLDANGFWSASGKCSAMAFIQAQSL
ncbi:hypothetical protein [Janthinobacterium sp.]|uniref:hypothetical protein n=1 Tax=Janthinobacterium sp. TaxID=1871054 RepID=UPI00293D77C4|nr:hypothetical protein [Janthinobacterium sp.]